MANREYKWTLTAQEYQGGLRLTWHTDAPFRAQQGQLRVYNGDSFPSNAEDDTKTYFWDTNSPNNTWDTGLDWGTGWHCAWVAQQPSNGPYIYVVTTITNSSTGPDTPKSE